MTFQAFCSELQRRLPLTISGIKHFDRAVIGLDVDPMQVSFDTPIDLPSLIEMETLLAVRALALKMVTVH